MDLSQIPTAQLQQIIAANQPKAAPKADLSQIPTDVLQKMIASNQPAAPQTAATPQAPEVPATAQSILGNINQEATTEANTKEAMQPTVAAATGVTTGIMDTGKQMGTLASTILGKGFDAVKPALASVVGPSAIQTVSDTASNATGAISNAYNQGEQLLTGSDDDLKAQAAYPKTFGGAATVANIGAQTALLNPAASKLTGLISPALKEALPLATSPALTGAINQGIVGGTIGAIQNPNHPLIGALVGSALGGSVGGLSGAVGEQVNRAGKVISDTVDDMLASGKDPSSLESIEAISNQVNTGGPVIKKYDIGQAVKAKVNDSLSEMRPNDFVPGTSPISTMLARTEENAPLVKAQNDNNYAPIDTNTQTFKPTSFQTALTEQTPNLPKIGMPKELIQGDDLTINQMLSNRKMIDGTIQQAKNQFAGGKIPQSAINPYYLMRTALNNDIHTAADSVPYKNPTAPKVKTLGDQLSMAEKYNQEQVKPFQTLDKNGGYVDNPKATTAAMQQIATQLQARRPNFVKIQNASTILGPEGKKMMAWGVVENAFNKATTISGEFKPETLQSNLTRIRGSGLLDTIFDEQDKQAVLGISRALEGATKNVPGPASKAGWIATNIQSLSQSRSGLSLLRYLGNPSVPAQQRNAMIKQLITGILVHATSPATNRK